MRTVIETILILMCMIALSMLFIIKFNAKAENCDQQMGYQCNASQVFNQ